MDDCSVRKAAQVAIPREVIGSGKQATGSEDAGTSQNGIRRVARAAGTVVRAAFA